MCDQCSLDQQCPVFNKAIQIVLPQPTPVTPSIILTVPYQTACSYPSCGATGSNIKTMFLCIRQGASVVADESAITLQIVVLDVSPTHIKIGISFDTNLLSQYINNITLPFTLSFQYWFINPCVPQCGSCHPTTTVL